VSQNNHRQLHIGYYLAGVREGLTLGGTATYAARILENMLAHAPQARFHLLIAPEQRPYAAQVAARFPGSGLSWSVVRESRVAANLARPVEALAAMSRSRHALAGARTLNHLQWQTIGKRLDLIHCPLQTTRALAWRTPTLITMHDVQELRFPEFFSPFHRLYRAGVHWWAMELASRVVVSFAHVREDLLRYFRLPPAKVAVCPVPVNADWLPAAPPAADVCARHGIAPDFLLYPAQTWPHKNHLGLLRALAELRDTAGLRPTLVCTGKTNEYFPAIRAEVERLGLNEQVRFPGVVSAADLAGLYRACRCVVVPTLYEAGSFPVLEALLLGAPVICARTTSLPETMGDPRFTFDPHAPGAIAEAVRLMLTDEQHYAANRANGEQRRIALAETPQRSAEAFLGVYEGMLAGHRAG
jgi:glycosyltransferase involved in cell wall biosynthesis